MAELQEIQNNPPLKEELKGGARTFLRLVKVFLATTFVCKILLKQGSFSVENCGAEFGDNPRNMVFFIIMSEQNMVNNHFGYLQA